MSGKYTLDGLTKHEQRILDRLQQKVATRPHKLTEQEVQAILNALRQQSEGVSWAN
jgi:hypothetical protein